MNDESKPASAVEMLLDKLNYMMSVINTLESRIYDLERKVNQPTIQLSEVAYTWRYDDLIGTPNIPNTLTNTYSPNYTYCTSAGYQPQRYVTDMQNQNWNLVIQFSDGTTAQINDEWL